MCSTKVLSIKEDGRIWFTRWGHILHQNIEIKTESPKVSTCKDGIEEKHTKYEGVWNVTGMVTFLRRP